MKLLNTPVYHEEFKGVSSMLLITYFLKNVYSNEESSFLCIVSLHSCMTMGQ